MATKTSSMVPLPGSDRPHPSTAQRMSAVEDSTQVTFTVMVRRNVNAPPLPDLDYWQNTPISQRQFMDPDSFAQKYGASEVDMKTTASMLSSHGMTVLAQNAGSRSIVVKATSKTISTAFNVQLHEYEGPMPDAAIKKNKLSSKIATMKVAPMAAAPAMETYMGYDGHISVPADLQDVVVSMHGLDTRSVASVSGSSGDPTDAYAQNVRDMANIYGFPNTGASDQTIGVFCGSGSYIKTDVTQYFASQPAGYNKAPTIVDVPLTVNGFTYTYNERWENGSDEVSQDIQTCATVAQGCTVNVYFTDYTEQGWITFFNRVLFPQGNEKQPSVLTISWIVYDETNYADHFSYLLQELATMGISIFAAVGDWGAEDNIKDGQLHVGCPGSDPWATCVGGTVVGNIKPGPPVTFDEYAWSDANQPSQFNLGDYTTTGGGMSVVFPTPSYQKAAQITSFTDSAKNVHAGGRFLPDIAGMVGFTGFVFQGFGPSSFTGTSCSAPLYAGLFSVLHSYCKTPFGFLNPTLYQLGSKVFNDVKIGTNDRADEPNLPFYNAAIGFDPVSGWGSINGTKLLNALKPQLPPPTTKFTITVNHNSFGLSDVKAAAAKNAAHPGYADFPSALAIQLDGFAPKDISGTPSLASPVGSDLVISFGKENNQLSSSQTQVQRILFPINVSFGPKSQHPSNDPKTPGVFPQPGFSGKINFTVQLKVGGQVLKANSELALYT